MIDVPAMVGWFCEQVPNVPLLALVLGIATGIPFGVASLRVRGRREWLRLVLVLALVLAVDIVVGSLMSGATPLGILIVAYVWGLVWAGPLLVAVVASAVLIGAVVWAVSTLRLSLRQSYAPVAFPIRLVVALVLFAWVPMAMMLPWLGCALID